MHDSDCGGRRSAGINSGGDGTSGDGASGCNAADWAPPAGKLGDWDALLGPEAALALGTEDSDETYRLFSPPPTAGRAYPPGCRDANLPDGMELAGW